MERRFHAIVDNYAAHKHPNVGRWLERHPRWTFHFTPTSASWLNAVEGFFANLTKPVVSNAASFVPSPTYKPRSTASSKSTISNRRPSSGPPIQTKSSPQSGAGTKCWIDPLAIVQQRDLLSAQIDDAKNVLSKQEVAISEFGFLDNYVAQGKSLDRIDWSQKGDVYPHAPHGPIALGLPMTSQRQSAVSEVR